MASHFDHSASLTMLETSDTDSGIGDSEDGSTTHLGLFPKTEKGHSSDWAPSVASQGNAALSLFKDVFGLRPRSSKKLRPTAWLDGLRGFAAFLVYWHHHELWAHDISKQNYVLENGFGFGGAHHLATFPAIRLFFCGGHFAVAVFFVISGYVLALKPLSLVHDGALAEMGDCISSALFRRWLRLFLPLIVVITIYASAWHICGLWVRGTHPQNSWGQEMWHLFVEFKSFSFVFRDGGNPWLSYNFHLWSIPLEFKGSLVIYASVLALARFPTKTRVCLEAGLVVYFLYIVDGWYCALFMAGMAFCDLDQLASREELPQFLDALRSRKTFIAYHLLAASLYLGGVPCQNRDISQLAQNRGWYYLSFLKPQAVFDYKWFFLFWASIFLIVAIPNIPWLKRFFESRFCQYLGRISYGLYMIHGPVLWILGDRLYFATGWENEAHWLGIPQWAHRWPLPRSGPLGLELSFLVPHIILLPVTLLLADLVTSAVDAPCVWFVSWLYRALVSKPVSLLPMKRAQA